MNPIISIIVPVYNLEKYLDRCLDSIIHQTYTNLQIIVVNDGSKDNSVDVIKEYACEDRRIVFIDKPNEGVSIARNVGIDNAIGEYIMFVDGDDWIDDNMIEELYKLASENQADFVGGGFIFEDMESGRKRLSPGGFKPQIMIGKDILKNYFIGYYLWGSVWGGIYKREFLNKHNLRFDKEIHYGEDVFFNAQVMAKAQKVIVCENRFYHVLVRPSSVTRNSVHELIEKKEGDYIGFLKSEGLWKEYQEAYKIWFIRASNYKLYHLALKVGYKDFQKFFKHYIQTTNYLAWNTFQARCKMNIRNHILSLIGRSSLLIWLAMYIPNLLGKKILA